MRSVYQSAAIAATCAGASSSTPSAATSTTTLRPKTITRSPSPNGSPSSGTARSSAKYAREKGFTLTLCRSATDDASPRPSVQTPSRSVNSRAPIRRAPALSVALLAESASASERASRCIDDTFARAKSDPTGAVGATGAGSDLPTEHERCGGDVVRLLDEVRRELGRDRVALA